MQQKTLEVNSDSEVYNWVKTPAITKKIIVFLIREI